MGDGGARGLRQWMKAYPSDPLVESARRQLNAIRRSSRRPRTDVAAADSKQKSAEVVPPVVEPSALESIEIEHALAYGVAPSSTVADDDREWLERDIALTADLSFERSKLEDAVAQALDVRPELEGPKASDDLVLSESDHPDTGSQEATGSPPSAPTAISPEWMLLVAFGATAASSGGSLAAVQMGIADNSLGNLITVVLGPAVYGAIIVAPALFRGQISLARAVLLTLVVPALATCAGFLAMLAYTISPKEIAEPVYGAVGSVIGAVVLLNALAASNVIHEVSAVKVALASLLIAVPVVALELTPWVGVRTPMDSAFTMLAWEFGFSYALVVISAMRPVVTDSD